MSDVIRKFRTNNGVPVIELPGMRRLYGGKDLNGGIWIQVEGCPRVTMPPKHACEFAIGILKACGISLEECDVDNLLK